MKVLVAIVFVSLSASAQDFTRYQAENDHYRDFSREQFQTRLGEASALLPFYACDGKSEFDPFFQAPLQNPSATSLMIQAHKRDQKLVYQAGNYYNLDGSPAEDFSNIFVAFVVEAIKKIEALPEGARMLRSLERSYFPITVTFGGNSFNPIGEDGRSYRGIYMANAISIVSHGRMTSEDIPFNNIGAGGFVNWDPKSKGFPPHVALAHEMFHALDSSRGILDMRFVNGEKYEFVFVSEYRAVWMENLFRKAAGVDLRTHYGQDRTGPGVLDENGNSRFISSPCLTN